MKTNKCIIFLMLAISMQSICQVPVISWPLNYGVFQRDNSTSPNLAGQSSVAFAGQVFNRTSIQYRIEKLNVDGSFNSDWKPYQSLPAGSITNLGSSNSACFYYTLTVPTGWYRFSIKDGGNNIKSLKFGVGEVFVIAGQSNAQGYGDQQAISGLTNYDCVVACKTTYANASQEYLEPPTFNVLNVNNPSIGPRGDRPWYYQKLGNDIVNRIGGQVIPVLFFNTAMSATSIENWHVSMQKTRTMFSNNYANPIVIGANETHCSAWGCYNWDKRQPYLTFKNVISLYGNMFGIRAVLWHQGEAETKYLLTKMTSTTYFNRDDVGASTYNIDQYDTKLTAIINDSRSILSNLTWAISKVSLISEYKAANAKDYNITNNNNFLTIPPSVNTYNIGNSVIQEQTNMFNLVGNICWASQNSDTYTHPSNRTQSDGAQLDGTHFNEAGLNAISNDIYNNGIPSILTKIPILPSLPLKVNLVKTGSNYFASTTSGYSYYQWDTNQWDPNYILPFYQNSSGMANSYNATGAGGVSGFTKNSTGRIYVVTPQVKISGVPGARIANELQVINSVAYPNPIQNSNQLNLSFVLEEEKSVSLTLYTESGILIETIGETLLSRGEHKYLFDLNTIRATNSKELNSLILKIITPNGTETKRIILSQ